MVRSCVKTGLDLVNHYNVVAYDETGVEAVDLDKISLVWSSLTGEGDTSAGNAISSNNGDESSSEQM